MLASAERYKVPFMAGIVVGYARCPVSRSVVYRVRGNCTGTAARTTAGGSPTAKESAA